MKVGTARPPAYVTVPLSTVSLNLRAGIGPLRAVLNSGHRRGGKFTRYHGGQASSFATFAPVAVAAIGTLPLPVMHRSIVIHIARRDGRRQLTRLDGFDLGVGHRNGGRIAVGVELATDREAGIGRGGGDQLHDHLMAQQRLAAPIAGDE
jgi:hypothetical protein